MPINEKQSHQLDELLLFLQKEGFTCLDLVKEKLFPEESIGSCRSLFNILKQYHPNLLGPENDILEESFGPGEYVEEFLNNGGFAALYRTKLEASIKLDYKAKLELEKLQLDVKNSKRIYKTYWFTFFFALLAFLISIFNFIKGFFY